MFKSYLSVMFLLQTLFLSNNIINAESVTIPLSLPSKQISFINQGPADNYTRILIPGYSPSLSPAGSPDLPAIRIAFCLPAGAEIIKVRLDNENYSWVNLEKDIFPSQPDLPLNGETKNDFVKPDSSIYSSKQFYPQTMLGQERSAARGESLYIEVQLTPFRYIPAEKTLGVMLKGDLVVDYALNPASRSFPQRKVLMKNRSQLPNSRQFLSLISNIPESEIKYLVITSNELAPSFLPLAAWRARSGLPAHIQTTEWIAANVPGADLSEKIRNYIKACWLYCGTEYVLLGGDTEIVPARNVCYVDYYVPGNQMPSDLYYSDIVDTTFAAGFWGYNFNRNGNSRFGELPDNCGQDDGIDLVPDLCLGRSPVKNLLEAELFVAKIISYEKNPAPNFAENVLILADGNFAWFGELAGQLLSNYAPWIQKHRMYNPVSGSYYNGDELLTVSNGLARLNQGHHIVYHFDHGGQYSLSLAKDHSSAGGGWIYRPQVSALSNSGRHSIIVTPACSPNAYDFSSISEYLINNSQGGALAFIGNSRVGWTSQYPQFNRFFEALYVQNHDRIGVIFNEMIMAGSSYGHYSLNLLGDPALRIYRRHPANIQASHPTKIEGARPVFSLALGPLSYGQPQAEAVLSRGREVLARKTISSATSDSLSLSGISEGWLDITIIAPDHLPYVDSCYLSTSQQPLLLSYSIDDSLFGNGDGWANPGEKLFLIPEIDFSLVSEIRLRTDDANLNIIDSTVNLLTSAEHSRQARAFLIQVAPELRSDHRARLEFVATPSSGAEPHCFTRTVDILSDSLIIYSARIAPGPSLNSAARAYYIDSLVIANVGSGASGNVKLWNGLDTISIGVIPAGQTLTLVRPFRQALSFIGGDLTFTLHARDAYDRTRTFEMPIFCRPGTITDLKALPGERAVSLSWSYPDEEILGFNIYRQEHGKPDYIRINSLPVSPKCYLDNGVLPGKTYHYAVTAVGRNGSQGPLSNPVLSACRPSIHPGFPKLLGQGNTGTRMWSNPAAGDINGDGFEEIVLGSDDGFVYVFDHQGNNLPGWPKDLGTNQYGSRIVMENSSPTLVDLDGDGLLDIIMGNGPWYGNCGDYSVHAWRYDGSEIPGWPQTVYGDAFAAISAADLDGDGLPEVLAATNLGMVYLWDGGGNLLPGWPLSAASVRVMSGAAVGNLDGDPQKEIAVAANDGGQLKLWVLNIDGSSLPGWPKVLQTGAVHVLSSPAMADMDGDDSLEIILASEKNSSGISYVYCLKSDGSHLAGWPLAMSFSSTLSSPAIGDLNNDSRPEIALLSGDGLLYSLSHNNGTVINWSREAPPNGRGSPVISDLNGDGISDVAVATEDGYLRAMSGIDGSDIPGFPLWMESSWSAPTISDVDGDGQLNLIAFGWGGHRLFVWDLPSSTSEQGISWSCLGGDMGRTGCYRRDTGLRGRLLSYSHKQGRPESSNDAFIGCYPNPFVDRVQVSFQISSPAEVALDIYNLCGQKVASVFRGCLPAGKNHLSWNGKDEKGKNLASGIYLYRLRSASLNVSGKLMIIN